MNIDWKRKLTSRKFWLAVVTMITGIIVAFSGNGELANTISGCIMSTASVIAYIIGEGMSDEASVLAEAQKALDKEEPEKE